MSDIAPLSGYRIIDDQMVPRRRAEPGLNAGLVAMFAARLSAQVCAARPQGQPRSRHVLCLDATKCGDKHVGT